MSKSSLEAAAEAAAKVNAMLIAKGKLSPSQVKSKIGNNLLGRGKMAGDLITAEVDINDAPISARNLLTRGHMQDEICKQSGVAISTRGRYMTPEERQNIATPECRPLYLNLQASSYDAIKVAVRKISDIIDHHVAVSGQPKSPTVGVVTYPATCSNGSVGPVSNQPPMSSGTHFVQDKVFVGLEQAPPDYPVRDKILGPAGTFLQHIRTETGATVYLRGKGSGFIEPTSGREAFEPLYIHITHPKPEGLQAAKALAINLVETAHVEFAQWQQTQQQSVLQPLTSVVLPQATPVAYQNQVMVTPTVLPGALSTGTSVVAAGIQIPASVAGTTLTAGIPGLVHASVPTLVSPVAVVSSVPVSVQAIPPQTVITYPTLVANTTQVLQRSAASVITRPATPAVSIFSVVPTLPATAAYTAARPRPAYQIQPVVYANLPAQATLPQPVQQTPTSIVMTIPEATNYPIISRYAQLPQQVPASMVTMHKQRYYGNVNVPVNSTSNRLQSNCLQESNVTHPTELQSRREAEPVFSQAPQDTSRQDRDLMPPPPHLATTKPPRLQQQNTAKHKPEDSNINEAPKKKLKGALVGIASIYGSDDSDDNEDEDTFSFSYH